MHQKNTLYHMRTIHRYTFWCQLTHFNGRWRRLWSICLNTRPLKSLVTHLYVFQAINWNNLTNVRIFPDGKVSTGRMSYINTVLYYWQKICRYGQFYLVCQFSYLYLPKRLLRIMFIKISRFSKPVLITAQNLLIQHKSNKYQRKVKVVVETKQ